MTTIQKVLILFGFLVYIVAMYQLLKHNMAGAAQLLLIISVLIVFFI